MWLFIGNTCHALGCLVLIVSITQSGTRWDKHLNEGLSRMWWPVAKSMGTLSGLLPLTEMGQPSHCECYHLLGLGSWHVVWRGGWSGRSRCASFLSIFDHGWAVTLSSDCCHNFHKDVLEQWLKTNSFALEYVRLSKTLLMEAVSKHLLCINRTHGIYAFYLFNLPASIYA